MSPPIPFALPAAPTHAVQPSGVPVPVPVVGGQDDNSAKGQNARPVLAISPAPSTVGMSYIYSPHRVVDGSTLAEREHQPVPLPILYGDFPSGVVGPADTRHNVHGHMHTGSMHLAPAARGVVRPVSTPPTPLQPEAPSSVTRVSPFDGNGLK